MAAPLAILTAHILEVPSGLGNFQIDAPQGLRRMLRTIEVHDIAVSHRKASTVLSVRHSTA